MRQFKVALRLSPCCGLRPQQRFGFDLQIAFASPNFGADAIKEQLLYKFFGTWQRHRLRYHFEVAIPSIKAALDLR